MESYDLYPTSSFQRRSFHWSNSHNNTNEYDCEKKRDSRRVYSRSRHQIPKSSIQKWIENVEKSVFDDGTLGQVLSPGMHLPSQQKYSRVSLAQMTLDQLRHHDEAQQEAEDLLNEWVQNKLYEPNILTNDLDEFLDQANKVKNPRHSPELSLSLDFDEDAAVDAVLQKMLQKNVVPVKVRSELGLDMSKKQVDPRVKMELRRKQVRENRMKREKEMEKRHQEMQLKKEARLKAHQKVMEEEKLKEVKRRQEEYEIQKQMALIRKQMTEEKKRAEAQRKKEQKVAEKLSESSEPEICHKEWTEIKETFEASKQERQQHEAAKIEMLKIRQKTLELQTLQRHFSAWYAFVLQQRLLVGKTCALADWKQLLRCWNKWKSVTRQHQIDKELQKHQQDIKDNQRKDKKASLHYTGHLLQKYFLTWQLYVLGEKERRQLEESQLATKKRMAALLDAAFSRTLPSSGSPTEKVLDKQALNKKEESPDTVRSENNGKVDRPTEDSTRLLVTVNGKKQSSMPNEHWKIKRSLVYMKPSKMAAMLGAGYKNDKNCQKSFSATNVGSLAISTIERQLDSQKKLVKEQQKQLKEQRRMIEQLQIDQRHQQLKKELKNRQTTDGGRHSGKEQIDLCSENGERSHSQPIKKRRNSISEPHSSTSSPRRSNMRNCDQKKTFALRRSQSMDYINTKDQKILKNMEARAIERKRMKEEREARKQQKAEEKLVLLKAAEKEHLKREEEERKAKLRARQEQKRLEQQREAERQKKLAEIQRLNAQADDFHKYLLLKYKGILPWKKLIVITRNNHIQAVQHSTSTLLRKCLEAWHVHVKETNNLRNELANSKCKQLLVVRFFHRWRNYNNYTTILEQKADRFYLGNLCFKSFKAWLNYSSEQTLANWEKEEMAQKHHQRQLQRRMFSRWKTFPEMKKKEMERQERKEKLRQKVSILIPDFKSEP